ncbi:hemin-binding periplasmic protein hmuT [Collimonas fungivorans]|uniref:Hemin-binding periplasmic protein hmuT n=1 Tax=Collimonas fungivorans TaxID=158899 RepID=A0A127PET6_9BURK|nr:ABC transporter substrate-binding protein [Collimonas fungivorans]AMO96267.1 hemin-binding periplasmic protein hmuT [Collimonas fungivorans]
MKPLIDVQRRLLLGGSAAGLLLGALPGLAFAKADAANPPRRVVVAGGALTEVVYALDAGAVLIGADTTSTYPAAAQALPKMGYQRALSAEGVLSLHPDLLLASADAGPPATLQQIAAAGVRVIRLGERHDVNTVREKITGVAAALELAARGKTLLQRFDSDWEAALAAVQKQRPAKAPRVLFILSNSGTQAMVAGQETAADAMIRYAGAINATSADGKGFKGYKPLTAESAVNCAPDILMIASESLAAIGGMERLLASPGLSLTPAARNRRVVAGMDSLLLLGFGPRLPQALTQLSAQLYG